MRGLDAKGLQDDCLDGCFELHKIDADIKKVTTLKTKTPSFIDPNLKKVVKTRHFLKIFKNYKKIIQDIKIVRGMKKIFLVLKTTIKSRLRPQRRPIGR